MRVTSMLGAAACAALIPILSACSYGEPTPPRASFRLPGFESAVPSVERELLSHLDDPKWDPVSSAAMCYVDLVNWERIKPGGMGVTLHKGDMISISGWMVPRAPASRAEAVSVQLSSTDGSILYDFSARRTARPDVSENERFRSMNLREPGFTMSASTQGMEYGSYQIRIVARQAKNDIGCAIGSAWRLVLIE